MENFWGDVQPTPGDFLTAGQCNFFVGWRGTGGAEGARSSAAFSISPVAGTITLKPIITTAVHTLVNFPITRAGRVPAKYIESNCYEEKNALKGTLLEISLVCQPP